MKELKKSVGFGKRRERATRTSKNPTAAMAILVEPQPRSGAEEAPLTKKWKWGMGSGGER
uniref:Uncharacterized protein n=1 Tax=Arundo donax TaxID=35708 RepID=A0A0A9GRV4_ARUDO